VIGIDSECRCVHACSKHAPELAQVELAGHESVVSENDTEDVRTKAAGREGTDEHVGIYI
jgi:hypothetical protein